MISPLKNWQGWVHHAPWLVLALGLTLSAAAFQYVSKQVAREARGKFEAECAAIERIVTTRLSSFTNLLMSLRGFMSHAQVVTHAEFTRYVSELDLLRQHPGVTTINYAQQVDGAAKAAFVNSVRKDTSLRPRGFPEFSIAQHAERASYHVITFVEPFDANAALFGLDLQSCCAGTQEALAAVRDSGEIISDPEILADADDYQWGLRLATYRGGLPTTTLEQRREAFAGSVGLRFSLSQLMEEIVPPPHTKRVRVRLHSFPRAAGSNTAFTPALRNMIIDSFASRPSKVERAVAFNKRAGANELSSNTWLHFGGQTLGIYYDGKMVDFSTDTERALPYLVTTTILILTSALFAMLRLLLRSRLELETAVGERTHELKQANDEMRVEAQKRIRLEREILGVAEQERERLGRDLHDDIGQMLTATAFLAQSLSQDLEARWEEGAGHANLIEKHLSETVERIRYLAQGLMPLASQVGSLSVALEQLARHARESFRIGCQVVCDPPEIFANQLAAEQLYRIAQEGLLNAVKHGHASSVTISLSLSHESQSLRMAVTDNGDGIDNERMLHSAGIGLRLMRKRCLTIGMNMSLERRPEGGTVLRVE